MKWVKFIGAAFVFVLILLKPEQAVMNAQRAMSVWYSSVAPAIFPFLALMPLLSSKEACKAYEKLFSRCMRPLFRLPGSAAPAVLIGMIAGSPAGAVALRNIASNSNLSCSEARRIALAVGGVSPAYLIMGVGQRIHGSMKLGIRLAAAQIVIQLVLLAALPRLYKDNDVGAAFNDHDYERRNPITAAVENILCICGYMVFYSVVAGTIAAIIGKDISRIILLMMDLPSGLEGLVTSKLPLKIMIQNAAVGFTGFCIIFQNMNVLNELNIKLRSYIGMRTVFAVMMAVAGVLMDSKFTVGMLNLMENAKISYSMSLLIAGILSLPVLYLLSNKSFLNKRKDRNEWAEKKKIPNI